MIDAEALVADVDGLMRILRREANMIHANLRRQILQLTRAVHHANGADVVSFSEQQFHDEFAHRPQRRRIRADHHALDRRGDAGCVVFLLPLHFDEAEAARGGVGKFPDMAEPRNVDAAVPGGSAP